MQSSPRQLPDKGGEEEDGSKGGYTLHCSVCQPLMRSHLIDTLASMSFRCFEDEYIRD